MQAALAFALELVGLWGLGAAGWSLAVVMGGPRWIVAAIVVAAAVVLWGLFAAPKARRRLRGMALTMFKTVFFGVATLAFGIAYGWPLMAVYGVCAVLHLILRRRFGDPAL